MDMMKWINQISDPATQRMLTQLQKEINGAPMDFTVFIPGNDAWTVYAGTTPWARVLTRTAAGDWYLSQTSGNNDNTMKLAFGLGKIFRRVAAGKGIKINSFKVAHKVTTQVRGAGTVTLKKIVYANGVAPAVTDLPVTGTLATAVSTNFALDTFTVTTPVLVPDDNSQLVIDIDIAATTLGCVWTVAGIQVNAQVVLL